MNEQTEKIQRLSKKLLRHSIALENARLELANDLLKLGPTFEEESVCQIVGRTIGHMKQMEACIDATVERVREFLPLEGNSHE